METVAPHTRLKPGREADHEAVHAVIPDEVDSAPDVRLVRALP